jgi:hypothetical protein
MKRYLRLKKNNEATHLRIETYYDIGGYNYLTYEPKQRGYYLSVVPVDRGNNMESFRAFSGVKQLIKPVSRKSKKAEAEAEKQIDKYLKSMIQYVLFENNLELEEPT